jgi:deazaflavin-dependent oxidoreductase (nitroreductase family)
MPTAPPAPPPGSIPARIWNKVTWVHVRLYRLSGGRLLGRMQGSPLLLLDHVGRRSGRRRTTPLSYMEDGDDLVVAGSRGGSEAAPAWWRNLEASPRTTVQVGPERREVVARTAAPEQRQRLWARLVARHPRFAEYQSRTSREIPLIVLGRIE